MWRHARGDGAHCPFAVRHAANRTFVQAVNRHTLNDFGCGTQSRREPPAALPVADAWRRAWSGPAGGRRVAACLERWRALPLRGPPRSQQHFPDSCSRSGSAVPEGRSGTTLSVSQKHEISF